MSILTPSIDLTEVRQAVCVVQHFCRDADAAAAEQPSIPGAGASGGQTFALYRRAALRLRPELQAR